MPAHPLRTVLITGGAGFIGSHTCVELIENGYRVVVVDDFSNSSPAAVAAIERLTGASVAVQVADVRDGRALDALLAGDIDAVIHFAARKAVGDSTRIPLVYSTSTSAAPSRCSAP